MTEIDQMKRAAAVRAVEWVRDGMVLGLGSGSTMAFFIEELGAQRSRGLWKQVVGVPTSERTATQARRYGIPLSTLAEHPAIDLAIDGADEVDPELHLIKGLGGALLREKIVATAAETVLIIVDLSKRVDRLGTRARLPVEVDPFSGLVHDAFFRAVGAEPRLRTDSQGNPFVTDGGNHIFDLHFPDGIDDPTALDARLNCRPGIIENGLFVELADHVLVASPTGVELQSHGDPRP